MDLAPILLVHGAWHGSWCWERHFVPYFEAAGHEIRTIDLPGHGKDQGKRPMWRNRISHYTDAVHQSVQTFDAPPFVIGHSMGGFVVQHLLSRPVKTAGIGLLATVPPSGALGACLRSLHHAPGALFRAGISKAPTLHQATKLFLDPDVKPGDHYDDMALLIPESIFAIADQIALNLPRRPLDLPPMCVIGAQADRLFPPASQQTTAQHYNAECHIIDGAGHDLMLSAHWRGAADLFLSWIKRTAS